MIDRTVEENKKLIERYPYLLPRSLWTDEVGEDYDYSYIRGIGELPYGWEKLFLQMCEDIRQPLIDADYLDKFRLSQIKDKYGMMHCYNFGAPAEVHKIIAQYEYVSQFVCEDCGAPGEWATRGWIATYCNDCVGKYNNIADAFKFNPIMRVIRYNDGVETTEEIDVSDIWNRLYNKED